MPESVSPDFTLYDPLDEPEEDVLDAVEADEDAEPPESFKVWPGYITDDMDKPLALNNVERPIPCFAAMPERVSPVFTV